MIGITVCCNFCEDRQRGYNMHYLLSIVRLPSTRRQHIAANVIGLLLLLLYTLLFMLTSSSPRVILCFNCSYYY